MCVWLHVLFHKHFLKALPFLDEDQRNGIKNNLIDLMTDIDGDYVAVPDNASNVNEQKSDSDSDSCCEMPIKKRKGLSGLLGAFYQEKSTDPEVKLCRFWNNNHYFTDTTYNIDHGFVVLLRFSEHT